MRQEWKVLDKSEWPVRGEWDNEPDKVQWVDEATGLDCLAVRARSYWCGYVGVPEGHPSFGKEYNDVDVSVHGGLTFASLCMEPSVQVLSKSEELRVCHVPEPGRPAKVWWLGFDCAHSGDYRPPENDTRHRIDRMYPMPDGYEHYRALRYVEGQCKHLAAQLAEQK